MQSHQRACRKHGFTRNDCLSVETTSKPAEPQTSIIRIAPRSSEISLECDTSISLRPGRFCSSVDTGLCHSGDGPVAHADRDGGHG